MLYADEESGRVWGVGAGACGAEWVGLKGWRDGWGVGRGGMDNVTIVWIDSVGTRCDDDMTRE